MTRLPSFVLSLAAGALLLAACGTSGSSGTASTPAPSPTPAPVVKTATAMVAGQSMTILVGASNGMTLYYYTPDKGAGKVTCTGACLTAWPPLLLSGADTNPTGDKSVTGTLGTIASPNGGHGARGHHRTERRRQVVRRAARRAGEQLVAVEEGSLRALGGPERTASPPSCSCPACTRPVRRESPQD